MSVRRRALIGTRKTRVAAILLAMSVSWPAGAALNCTVSATPVAFGLYSPLAAADLDSTGNVQVSCDGGKGQVTIQLSPGASGDANDRRMYSGASFLRYNLYDRAARSQVWGDGAGGTRTVRFNIPRDQPISYDATVYGRVFAGQSPEAGFYVDNIVVTVLF